MNYGQIESKVVELANYVDGRIELIEKSSLATQQSIYAMLNDEILKFEISQGQYVVGQDLRKRLAIIEGKINSILGGKDYTIPMREFLTDFTTIQDKTIDLFKSVNDLELDLKELRPAKQIIYEQARDALTKAVAPEYVEPLKKLIAQNVMQGRSLTDTVKQLERWNEGELSSGRLANGTPTPNLQKYAVQMARDSAYSVSRTTNNIFKDKFGLTKFVFAGGLVKDSRPLCKYMVSQNREFTFEEMPPLFAQMPEGLYPQTQISTYTNTCNGYGCRHIIYPVA